MVELASTNIRLSDTLSSFINGNRIRRVAAVFSLRFTWLGRDTCDAALSFVLFKI